MDILGNMHTIVLNNILDLIKLKSLTDIKFCEELGFGAKTVDNWKRGVSKSYMKNIEAIAEYFNVSTDYLLGKTKNSSVDSERLNGVNFAFNNLSEDDIEIIKRTKDLPSKKKQAILNLLNALEEDD